MLASITTDNQLYYNVTGGILPPHLMLNQLTGIICGFCEFHAISKTYQFDITVNNGLLYVTQQFSLTVNKIYGDQFFGASIPTTGELRTCLYTESSNILIRSPGLTSNVSMYEIVNAPTLNVINGIIFGYEEPNEIIDSISNWLGELSLTLGQTQNSTILSNNYTTLYRNINDNQSNTSVVTYSDPVFNTNVQTNGLVYPISINNLRSALISNRSFVTTGTGSSCLLYPELDWSTGSLISITILNSGNGYVVSPSITISGSGSDAVVESFLGLVSVSILNSGYGWNINDVISVSGNIGNDLAIIQVTNVGINGSLLSVDILNIGNYQQIQNIYTYDVYLSNSYASFSFDWGVTNVQIISGGANYQSNIIIDTSGYEILPAWQETWMPAIKLGQIDPNVAIIAETILDFGVNSLYGVTWNPNFVLLQFNGIKWQGETSFVTDNVTFDGDTTRFQETISPIATIFDDDNAVFDTNNTTFDYTDPLEYNLFQLWGNTLFDLDTTIFDLYNTIFDELSPSTQSMTLVNRWVNNKNTTYSGNNAVW